MIKNISITLVELLPGDVIQQGDLLLLVSSDRRTFVSIDWAGNVFGAVAVGRPVERRHAWFRPSAESDYDVIRREELGQLDDVCPVRQLAER